MLPIRPLHKPLALAGQTNGKLDPKILEHEPGLAGGPDVVLVAQAMKSWRAMTAAAQRDGIILKAAGPADSYRPYEIQERIFRQRYTRERLPGRPSKVWQGVQWWQKPGTAAAAVPGQSNHGLGLAVDVGTETDGDAGTESITEPVKLWLLHHTDRYGWSWELQSEPWHIRYVAGDMVPQAVLDHEQGGGWLMALTDKQQNELYLWVRDLHNAALDEADPNDLADEADVLDSRNKLAALMRRGFEKLGVDPKSI